jgi:hypothetical protein
MMQLITQEIRKKLLANHGNDGSAQPVLKLFCPWGAATWLISEMDPEDENYLYGLCDLGMGSPEVGGVYLPELEGIEGPLNLKIERDRYWSPDKTLNEYADEAVDAGRILS